MAKANIYAGSLLIAFALYFIYESLKLPFWTSVGPGAGAPPILYGSVFMALSLVLLAQSVRAHRSRDAEQVDFSKWRTPATVLGGLLMVVLLAKTLGMLLTIFLFVSFYTMMVERIRWIMAIPVALATALVFYLVFEMVLGVPLVIGVFGI